MTKTITALTLLVALAACGSREALRPAQGASLPPRPAMATTVPTPDQLLTADVQQRPERTEELLRKSQERGDDRFNLPPQ